MQYELSMNVEKGLVLQPGQRDTSSSEDLIARLNDDGGKFYQVWSHFTQFLQFQLTCAP